MVTPVRLPIVEIITSTETVISKANLNQGDAEKLRSKVCDILTSSKPPVHNNTKEKKKALSDLMKDNYLSIVPADKERCVVVLNKSDYNEKCKELLTDDSTYKCNGQNPTSGYRKKVFNLIKNLFENNIINVMLKRKLDPPSESTILAFYGLPKIHRPKLILFRPIVSCIGSITYRLAKFAAGILCPLVGQSPHYVCNTMEFVVKNKNIRLYDSEILTSYDVLAQFTSIPADFTVNIIQQQLTDDPTLSS